MKTGGKFFSTILRLGILLLLITLAASSWMAYSHYRDKAVASVAEHKRVLIDLAATNEAAPVAPEENAAKPEETNNTAPAAAPAPTAPEAPPSLAAEHAIPSQAAAPAPAAVPATPATPKQPESPATAKVAIIITGMGLSKSSTVEAMKLPPAISFSFSPYSSNLNEWFQAAKANGNSILLDLPLEPNDYPITDPGPYALLTSLTKEENLGRLKELLSLADPALSGLVASRDEKFSSSVENLAALLNELKNHNLRLYFANNNSTSPVLALSSSFDVPVFVSDVIIDDKINEAAIKDKLAELEKSALAKGSGIAIARPYPLTVKEVAAWIQTLDAKGIKLVPAAEIQGGTKQNVVPEQGGNSGKDKP